MVSGCPMPITSCIKAKVGHFEHKLQLNTLNTETSWIKMPKIKYYSEIGFLVKKLFTIYSECSLFCNFIEVAIHIPFSEKNKGSDHQNPYFITILLDHCIIHTKKGNVKYWQSNTVIKLIKNSIN